MNYIDNQSLMTHEKRELYSQNSFEFYYLCKYYNFYYFDRIKEIIEEGYFNINYHTTDGNALIMLILNLNKWQDFTNKLFSLFDCGINRKKSYNKSKIELVKLLIANKDFDLNFRCSDGRTALMIASFHSYDETNFKIIKLLLKSERCNINQQSVSGWNVLMHSVDFYTTKEMNKNLVKLLIESGRCDLNLQNSDGYTALMIACRDSNIDPYMNELIKLLIQDKDIDLNIKNNNGITALMLACANSKKDSNDETVKLLIENEKCDLNAQDKNGLTALMIAICNYPELSTKTTIKLLIENQRCNLNIQNNDGATALIHACLHKVNKGVDSDIIRLLLHKKDSDLNLQEEKTGYSALMILFKQNVSCRDKVYRNNKHCFFHNLCQECSRELEELMDVIILFLKRGNVRFDLKNNYNKSLLDIYISNFELPKKFQNILIDYGHPLVLHPDRYDCILYASNKQNGLLILLTSLKECKDSRFLNMPQELIEYIISFVYPVFENDGDSIPMNIHSIKQCL